MDRQVRRMVTQRGEETNADNTETAIAPLQSDSDNEDKNDNVNSSLFTLTRKKMFEKAKTSKLFIFYVEGRR